MFDFRCQRSGAAVHCAVPLCLPQNIGGGRLVRRVPHSRVRNTDENIVVKADGILPLYSIDVRPQQPNQFIVATDQAQTLLLDMRRLKYGQTFSRTLSRGSLSTRTNLLSEAAVEVFQNPQLRFTGIHEATGCCFDPSGEYVLASHFCEAMYLHKVGTQGDNALDDGYKRLCRKKRSTGSSRGSKGRQKKRKQTQSPATSPNRPRTAAAAAALVSHREGKFRRRTQASRLQPGAETPSVRRENYRGSLDSRVRVGVSEEEPIILWDEIYNAYNENEDGESKDERGDTRTRYSPILINAGLDPTIPSREQLTQRMDGLITQALLNVMQLYKSLSLQTAENCVHALVEDPAFT